MDHAPIEYGLCVYFSLDNPISNDDEVPIDFLSFVLRVVVHPSARHTSFLLEDFFYAIMRRLRGCSIVLLYSSSMTNNHFYYSHNN